MKLVTVTIELSSEVELALQDLRAAPVHAPFWPTGTLAAELMGLGLVRYDRAKDWFVLSGVGKLVAERLP